MSLPHTDFYVTGGTVPSEAPSYIPRRADNELYTALHQGEFCYVLTSRQMGKSSLMVRTAARLRESDATVAIVDLTALGLELTALQWYDSLLAQIGEQLGLEDELDAFCSEHRALSPLQRWRAAVREIALNRRRRIVIFIDEIDLTRSLPFSTDEFFAAIRELYNSRAKEPGLSCLTFCLLGVATPSDLIRDARLTPFNIGRRIELTDFTAEEAAPLGQGLTSRHPQAGSRAKAQSGEDALDNRKSQIANRNLLDRVLYWTGGHPYLTQRLCHAVAECGGSSATDREGPNQALVDRLCTRMYLGENAEIRDDNLAFVRNRLLKVKDVDLAGLLLLYGEVLKRRHIPADDANAAICALRLAGVVRGEAGLLYPRNRIYEHVFDLRWVRSHLPGVELRRQNAAFRRGALRATGVLTLLLIAASLAIFAAQEKGRRAAAELHIRQLDAAQKRADTLLNAADMYMAYQRWEAGDIGQTLALLDAHRSHLRDFEWRYLWSQCHQAEETLPVIQKKILSGAISPDGEMLASGGSDGSVILTETKTWRPVATLKGHSDYILCLAFSPDGKTLASASEDRTVVLWDVNRRTKTSVLKGIKCKFCSAAFSPNGRMLATGNGVGGVWIWDTVTLREIRTLSSSKQSRDRIGSNAVAFSPDGTRLASDDGHGVRVWNTESWKRVGHDLRQAGSVFSFAFTHDGNLLAAGSGDGTITLWNVSSQRKVTDIKAHSALVSSAAFSHDDRTLATASWDDTVSLWDVPSGRKTTTYKGHADRVTSVAFLRNNSILASSSTDGTIRLWNAAQARGIVSWNVSPNEFPSAAFSPDSRVLALGSSDGTVTLWDVFTRKKVETIQGSKASIISVAFSPDGKFLAFAGIRSLTREWIVSIWNVSSRRLLKAFPIAMKSFEGHSAGSVVWSPDGAFLAAVHSGGKSVRLWNTVSWKEVGSPLITSTDRLFSIAFCPDGKTLAVADDSKQNRISLWNIATHLQVGTPLTGHSNTILGLTFSPKGDILASCSWDRSIRLWDLSTRQQIAVLHGHRSPVVSIAFSPDGKTLASGSDDHTVRLWNVEAGREVATLRGHTGKVGAVVFSPDRNLLASADDGGMVRLWRAIPPNDIDLQGWSKESQK